MKALQPVSFKKGREHLPRLSPIPVVGRQHPRFWSDEELNVIRDHYPSGGARACQVRLGANRNLRTIYQQANKLGLVFDGPGGGRQTPVAVPEDIDARIRAAWPLLDGKKRGGVSALADEFGVPRWWLTKRATMLHLTIPHKKDPPWTEAETTLMAKVPLHNPDRCSEIFRQYGFNRSPTAIVIRAKRLSLSRRATHENYSGTQASKILGVDNKTFTAWCIAGDVRATRRGTKRLPQQGGDVWDIPPAELRRFILDNLERIDLRKVEKFGFVHVLTLAGQP